jgi:hypothetical protein
MSLETVLQIGKVLRNSENSLKYFKYAEPCPKDKDGNWPICITIPVNEDFSFDWKGIEITPENQCEKLYYLRYSTSDNDSSPKKFLFGDICYTRKSEIDKNGKIKGIKDFGNFTFEKGLGNAFLNGQKTYEEIINGLYSATIKSGVFENVGEKNYESVMKFILSYYRSGPKNEIPKKLIQYSQVIETAIENLKQLDAENDFVLFHETFKRDLEKINKLLLFAPVFESYMNDKEIVMKSLSNMNILHEYYLNVVKSKSQSVLKRLLNKDETLESYSNETRNKFLQFADFTVFIHFKFSKDGKKLNWYQFDKTFDCIKDKLNSEVTNLTRQGLVPSKSIYRTLCSGNDKNDIQFPSFGIDNSFKSFAFINKEQFEDFLFTGSILNKPFRRLKYTNVDMFVYPVSISGEEISAKDYDDFFFEKKDESRLEYDPIFSILGNEGSIRFNRFDFVFADNSGNTTTDLIELSGIEKSILRTIHQRIETVAKEINLERNSELDSISEFKRLHIEMSFRNILGNTLVDSNGYLVFKQNAKYKSHLLKVLPLIYTANYYNDDLLLPSFVQVSEYIARNIEKKFIWYNYADLKYRFKFLKKIQNTKTDRFMEITTSESYQIGFMLGGMAKNLSQEINSFEKNYVGNLTRRVGTLSDFIKLKNEIEQKLIMHDKSKFTFQTSYDLAQKVKEFNTRYDKEECAFGFMESYFKPIPKKDPTTKKKDEINIQ